MTPRYIIKKNSKKENFSFFLNLKKELVPEFKFPKKTNDLKLEQFIVVSENQYSIQLDFKLMQAPLTKMGGIKSPVKAVKVLEAMNVSLDLEILPFYLALLQKETNESEQELDEQLQQIGVLLKNPLKVPFYHFQLRISPLSNSTHV